MQDILLDSSGFLNEFCLSEIALNGLEGCRAVDLFTLLSKSTETIRLNDNSAASFELVKLTKLFSYCVNASENVESIKYKNYVWRILTSQTELDFYVEKEPNSSNQGNQQRGGSVAKTSSFRSLAASKTTKTKASNLINDGSIKGYSTTYNTRKCVSEALKSNIRCGYQECLTQFGQSLVIVASQQLRNKVLAPSFKCMELENLNEIEYAVLEFIGRTRYEGASSIGPDGLTNRFDLGPKQLHYILNILESDELIRKQMVSSEKKRNLIHLARFALRRKSLLEQACDHLIFKHEIKKTGYVDSAANVRRKLGLSQKQMKALVAQAERQRVLKRFIAYEHRKAESTEKTKSSKTKKPMQVRMLSLTDEYYESTVRSRDSGRATKSVVDSNVNGADGIEEIDEADEDGKSSQSLGMAQSNLQPMMSQIFAKIEEQKNEGLALKNLGMLFGLDFYKARRMGGNLQMHPDMITIFKETNGGKAKYQAVIMRKFLEQTNNAVEPSSQTGQQVEDANRSDQTMTDTSLVPVAGGQKAALMSNRMQARQKLVLEYLTKHRICTKYEINREIRSREEEQGLSGTIDAKTTKRMLHTLEKEKKLHVFEVHLKNVNYMCVRAWDIDEEDEVFKTYCQTFKRTFDTVDLKLKKEALDENTCPEISDADMLSDSASRSPNKRSSRSKNQEAPVSKTTENPTLSTTIITNINNFNLTRNYIKSVVDGLSLTSCVSKNYGLVPKVQKAIILHRYMHYLLFNYDGNSHKVMPDSLNESTYMCESDVVNSIHLPPPERVFKSAISWQTFIPPLLNRQNSNTVVVKNVKELQSLFVGEIVSHMPLSIFCALVVINFQVPGLLALLKHPIKRHLLVKDLPGQLVAPLIHERRYIRRIFSCLQFMVALGLVAFVHSPCKANEAANRDTQSQSVYVYKRAEFFDTTSNECKDWSELANLIRANFNEKENSTTFERRVFEFRSDEDLQDYWRSLLNVSMNTYKFNVGNYLKEDKAIRKRLQAFITRKHDLDSLGDILSLKSCSTEIDHMGPGGYDSQLFLHYFQNWIIPSNVGASANTNADNLGKAKKAKRDEREPAITKEADQSYAPFSELALFFPFGVFRGSASSSSRASRKPKRKLSTSSSEDEREGETAAKKPRTSSTTRVIKFRAKNIKLMRAKALVDKAKIVSKSIPGTSSVTSPAVIKQKTAYAERRAIWHSDEDELILLIKVASLYLMPGERCIPFKLISDIMYKLMPVERSSDKPIASIGRRVKVLMKQHINRLFVLNKYELCKQDKWLEEKYGEARNKLKRNVIDEECIDLYIRFIEDVVERHIKKKSYNFDDNTGSSYHQQSSTQAEPLSSSRQEFESKYTIVNSNRDVLFKTQSSYFQQPTTDYEITCNTLHSAIHSSILINDKNPRMYESFHLFDKYSDQLLTDVITRMSRDHRIIAPTKYAELKKKNVTAFSKHIGKAYHISQRYQYKWMNNISPAVLNETKKFKDQLLEFKSQKGQETDTGSMFDCTDKDDLGMTSFLAHTIDNAEIQVQIDVPNKIWVSKLI